MVLSSVLTRSGLLVLSGALTRSRNLVRLQRLTRSGILVLSFPPARSIHKVRSHVLAHSHLMELSDTLARSLILEHLCYHWLTRAFWYSPARLARSPLSVLSALLTRSVADVTLLRFGSLRGSGTLVSVDSLSYSGTLPPSRLAHSIWCNSQLMTRSAVLVPSHTDWLTLWFMVLLRPDGSLLSLETVSLCWLTRTKRHSPVQWFALVLWHSRSCWLAPQSMVLSYVLTRSHEMALS